ncbi:MAG TPA: nitrogen fixation protein NifZ [Bradyrhizobium sp.]|nr:nitrogen fixation protein NifZ [Bradyrhizobium sp.]
MNTSAAAKPEVIGRIVHHAHLRRTAQRARSGRLRGFKAGVRVRAVSLVKNDGTYPHMDIGETLVQPGDAGIVRESWCFLGEFYYTVEFVARAVVVIMRDCEMVRIAHRNRAPA